MQTSHLNPMRWLVGLVLLLFPVSMPVGNSPLEQAAPSTTAESWLNLQVSGQSFAFRAKEFYLTNATYALHVQFIDAQAVTPQSTSPIASKPGSVPMLERVTYPDLWDGITLTYDAVDNGLARSSYRVEPGADVSAIRLRYNTAVTLNADGTLTTRFATGTLNESAPIAWQVIDGRSVAVAAAFRVWNDSTIGFQVGDYNAAYPLFIDPTLTWNAFLGGSGTDQGMGIAVDASGNIFVAGVSNAAWGCSPTPCTVRAHSGSNDTYVAKLDTNGNLTWNTFLGGTGSDLGRAIALDANGNIYVAGYSFVGWGSPVRAFTVNATNADAFAAKINPDGTLAWNTFLGGSGTDQGYGIAVDTTDNVYVAGYSNASWGAPVRAFTVNLTSTDAFAAKLNMDGSLAWNTFLGGSASDQGNGIAVDTTGNVYVGGYSQGGWGSPVRAYYGSGQDAFATKLDSSGNLTWLTFLGGSGIDYGMAIAIDTNGNVYVGGQAQAAWDCTPTTCVRRAFSVAGDAYATKLDTNGNLQWITFLGGSGNDNAYGIAVDKSGNVSVAGYSNATWGSPVRAFTVSGTNMDALVAKVDSNGNLLWNTFLGGTGNDVGQAVAVDKNGNVFVTGYSQADWGSSVRAYYGSGQDSFATVVNGACAPLADGNWNASPTWDCGSVPRTGDSVDIGSGKNVTLDVDTAVLNNVTISGTLTNNGVAHTLSLTGTWNNSGTFTPATFIGVTFEGTGTQAVNGSTAFYNLTINNGVVFDLGTAGSASVNGTLTNNGTIRATRSIAATGVQTFDLAGGPINGANVSLNITTNNFTSITLDRHDTQHPHFTGGNEASGIGYARYWTITPLGTGMVDITLPANFPTGANSKVCRYTGGVGFGWECAVDSYTANTVTRNGVTSFSDWATGNVGPTAITLYNLSAASQPNDWAPVVMLLAALLGSIGLFVAARHATTKRITD